MQDFDARWNSVRLQFAEKSINTELWYENKDIRSFVNVVPTSAHTGKYCELTVVELCRTMVAQLIVAAVSLGVPFLELGYRGD